jgi:hypothetical protein
MVEAIDSIGMNNSRFWGILGIESRHLTSIFASHRTHILTRLLGAKGVCKLKIYDVMQISPFLLVMGSCLRDILQVHRADVELLESFGKTILAR